ncbi:IS1182 family transposase [Aquisphaera insulae]|uniref:IS1182 family transposase n=1 Tax=Aquisphaera insulae TaxID=2712864 RepID=UPI00202F29D6|nr:IS1182 family transposase [Aquisphaera insulae]
MLFEVPGDPPAESEAIDPGRGRPRLRTADRQQVVFRAAPLDALIPDDHPARVVWAYVEGLDLGPLYARIKAVRGRPGRAPIDPKILMTLWLYATIEGVASARRMDALCRDHAAFRWIVGDVPTNYHTLADFRTDHVELLDDLLTRSVAALMVEGLVDLNRVAQDGMRVRASAGAASFRRRPTLEEALTEAEAQVEALRAEAEEDPGASDRRQKGARERAARERAERIKSALGRLPELEAKKKAGEKDKARCSTTDPEATVMKMADGGFRPAYDVQFCTATDGQVIVGVGVETTGSDAGQMVPMVEQIEERYDAVPAEVLVDGGFAQHDQIEAVGAAETGCTVYAPVPKPKDPKVDRHAPKPGDSEAVAAWRRRMETEEAKAIYKERAATAECVNAQARNRGLLRLLVRGLAKVKAIALWHALAHNLVRGAALRAAAAVAM